MTPGAGERPHRFDIAEVLARTDLAELLEEHSPSAGTARGRRWRCPVPDHPDNRPSVSIYTDAGGHQRWRCWSGDHTHRGDAVDLVMVTRRMERGEAIAHLAARAGLRPDEPLPPPLPRKPSPRPAGPRPLSREAIDYVARCAQLLWEPDMRPVRRWLANRGFTDETLRANRVGADPGRRRMPRARGLPRGDGIAAVFPALDPHANIRYLQTRYLHPSGGGPKYDNPAAAMGSNPRLAWPVPTTTGPPVAALIVCEGIPDALTAAQAGFRAVAVLGAQAPDRNVANRIAIYAEHEALPVVAITDADPAGRAFAQRLRELIAQDGLDVHLIEPPIEGHDLNDWASNDLRWTDWIPSAVTGLHPPNPPQPSPPSPALSG